MVKGLWDDLELAGKTNVEDLGWNCFGLHPSELVDVEADRDVSRFNFELLPLQRTPHKNSEQVLKEEDEPAIG